MPSASQEPAPRAGFSLPLDIVVNPARAFAKIAATHEWISATTVIVAASIATSFLVAPAMTHIAVLTQTPGTPAPHTPAQIAATRQSLTAALAFQEVMMPLLVVLLTASALTTVARFKGQATTYLTFVALAANCLIPSAIGTFAEGIAIRAHDPASFKNVHDLIFAFPTTLAVFANAANTTEVDFLARFDIFDVWSSIVLAFGYTALTQVKFITALALAFGLQFVFAVMFR